MQVAQLIDLLDELAPPALAEDWDNVGVLVRPSEPQAVRKLLLTIDLTEAVLDEALALDAQAILAYHPPIFSGLKRLVPEDRTGSLLLRAIKHDLLIYSPHTALDCVVGGVNDWLCGAFDTVNRRALVPKGACIGQQDNPMIGVGRRFDLETPTPLTKLVPLVKHHLGLDAIRLAESALGQAVRSVALCAGAGGSVLENADADLLLTGEMRHHDVLAHNAKGRHVILTDHTNSERGYLPTFKEQIEECGGPACVISEFDREPLRVV